jgi:hypothetical protein
MRIATLVLTASLTCASLHAQIAHHSDFDPNPVPATAPLPPNYQTILDNPEVLVMHVHYGAHEFVPMHDHPAVATLYVYLNDAGEVDIIHEGPNAVTAHRPPTHTGAFRIAPGIAERHSVQSNSDTDSNFLRVEFKRIELPDVPEAGKHIPAPASSTSGIHTDFENASLRVDRILCPADKPCDSPAATHRALLIPITATSLGKQGIEGLDIAAGAVHWLPPSDDPYTFGKNSQQLVVTFLNDPPPTSDKPCR